MFGHTSAEHLVGLVLEIAEECSLSLPLFANLSTDGPNINKSLHTKLESKLKEDYIHPGLLPFNSCNLHKCHNGFHQGIIVYGKESESLAFDLHSWFKFSPCKREDFVQVAFELQSMGFFDGAYSTNSALFYRHVETRWLTLGPALEKALERWDASKEYFLEYLPKQKDFEKGAAKNDRYKRIASMMKKEIYVEVQISFLIDCAVPLQRLLTLFQSQGPLIHVLFKELKSLLKTLMMRFIDQKLVVGKPAAEIIKIKVDSQENQLPLENIVVGARTERFLQKLSPHDARRERAVMMKFYVAVTSYLQKKLPLTDKVLISCGSLHPDSRKKQTSCRHIEYLAGLFPHVITENEVSNLGGYFIKVMTRRIFLKNKAVLITTGVQYSPSKLWLERRSIHF